jgi:NAD(P)-dependent dehydrogenase (short-subunit alcohol dehydrogenase family)
VKHAKEAGMKRFEDKRVVVTGAAQGIGKAIAAAFLAEGGSVLAVDIDRPRLEAWAHPAGMHTLAADLGDPARAREMVSHAVETLGGLEVLVNNAGVMPSRPILEIDEAEWDRTFAVNLTGPFFATQAAAGHMIDHGGGAVVNIASANAFQIESPEAHYNASKAALVTITRSFAHELGHLGVRFNCVAPGETVTDEEAAGMTPEDVEMERAYLERVPLRRPARPEEQAAAVLFLASEEASFVNGQTLIVDGGELTGDWFDPADRPPVPRQWFE